MAVEIVMPKQGNTVESCLIVEWRVAVGDEVSKGDILCEVETDKSTIEVEAEESGTVLARLYEEGDDVPVLKPMLILGDKGEDISSMISSSAPNPASEGSSPASAEEKPAPSSDVPVVEAQVQRSEGDFVAVSPRARKAAAEKAVDYTSLAGSGPNGRVIERDVLAFADANPSVSAAARAQGAIAGMKGSGIGGRLRSGEQASQVSAGARQTASAAAPIAPGEVREIKPSGIRKVIASRMRESLQSTAQFTLNASADARSIQARRKAFKNSAGHLGLQGITLGDMVVFAASRLLTFYPELNAEYKDSVIYQYSDVHMGLAVDTPRGLMVPVIRNADRKSLKEISDESKQLAAACQAGNISPDALSGATFTISNLGAFGIESFTPVIDAPQVAILGVCGIQPKPVQTTDGYDFVPHMGFSMTIDHQVVDGAPAARFLKEFCDFLANFDLATVL